MVADSNVLVTTDGAVALVTVNRASKLNALDRATLQELGAVFTNLALDAAVSVVILTGAGDKAFVAGADIAELAQMGPIEAAAYARLGQAVMAQVEGLGKPVIAAVNGFALGGGCELAMAATVRLAADKARFGQPEVKLGLMPGFAGTQRLSRLVGRARALELLLTGRQIDANEALAIGLVHRVVPAAELISAARSLANELLAVGPLALRAVMEAVATGLEAGFAEGCQHEAALFGLLFATRDKEEGTTAFLEKRTAKFSGT